MLYTDLTKDAMNLAYDMHEGVYDKAGLPYIFHPYHLAEQMGDDEYAIVVALLHDVVEDTDMTFEELEDYGYPEPVITALKLLTINETNKNDYLGSYIHNIKKNELAKKVKLADLQHNMDATRLLPPVSKAEELWTEARMKKYQTAIDILEGKLD